MDGGCFADGLLAFGRDASPDTLTANVGVYPPGPSGVYHPRVGVPPFEVTTGEGMGGGGDINDLAADQMTTLLDQTNRFSVIERAQLQKLLNEQGLEGVVRSDQQARGAQVKGVDYLLIGKVTNLRVKKQETSNTFNLGEVTNEVGGAAVSNSGVSIKTDCGVDIRFVNPNTGELMCSNFSEFSRTDSASSMGLAILGASASSGADIQLSDDDKGKILRLALDDAIKKSLPKLDNFLSSAKNVTTTEPPTTEAAR